MGKYTHYMAISKCRSLRGPVPVYSASSAIIIMEGGDLTFWKFKVFSPTPTMAAVAPMNNMWIITDGGVPAFEPLREMITGMVLLRKPHKHH